MLRRGLRVSLLCSSGTDDLRETDLLVPGTQQGRRAGCRPAVSRSGRPRAGCRVFPV